MGQAGRQRDFGHLFVDQERRHPVAALISGEVDFILDPPPQDLERLEKTPNVKVINGVENRVVFIEMDQARDELLYSNVKGKTRSRTKRVRRAMYQAIDIEAIKTKLMRGQAFPPAASPLRRSVPTTTRPSKSAVPMTWPPQPN